MRRAKSSRTQLLNADQRRVAEEALARLRVLRAGWRDVNRQYIDSHFAYAQRYNRRVYAVQYLEARSAVHDALVVLPGIELRAAIQEAMDVFEDLEAITEVFRTNSPFTTNVRVTDIFPYLKKYKVPYENGILPGGPSQMLHQDFVMSYVLPWRYARVNRVEVLLGGKVEPTPPPPTHEQMFGVLKEPTVPKVTSDELKELARQALEARLQGNRARMEPLLDYTFLAYGREGAEWNKDLYLEKMAPDQTVKSFEILRAELTVWNYRPSLTFEVKYESHLGSFKSAKYTLNFVERNGQWLIASWRRS